MSKPNIPLSRQLDKRCKLSEVQILEVIQSRLDGQTFGQIAKTYGVSAPCVSQLFRRYYLDRHPELNQRHILQQEEN